MEGPPDDPAANDRAGARKSWPIRRFRLGEEPTENLVGSTSAAQRLAMVGELTERGWALSGKAIPRYSRAETPLRRVRIRGVLVSDIPVVHKTTSDP